MKSIFLTLTIVLMVVVGTVSAQIDRTKVPPPGPAPAAAFPDYTVNTTSNGVRVIVIPNHEIPSVSVRLLIDSQPIFEGANAGCVEVTGALLRSGTKSRTKDQLDEEIDQLGASINAGGLAVYGSGLSKYTEKIIALMADVTLHPSFPKSEFDKLVMQKKSDLQYRKTEPNFVVDMLRREQVFGVKHPYGETETDATVSKITLKDCQKVYATYFKPNAAIVAVVGDVDEKSVVALIEKYFASWKKGTLPSPKYTAPKPIDRIRVALVDRPAAVQSALRIGQAVALPRTSPDVAAVEAMNTVLGGGAFRLFVNLREKHAYTYGAYSSMGPDELIGSFTANASTKTGATDSSVTEIFNEIRRIQTEKVGMDELQMAKNYLSGSFVRSLEDASSIASHAIDIERYKLPKDYYRTYLTRLDAVTGDDVQRVAKQYLQPDNMLIACVGSAADVKEKLAVFGPVTLYDEEGKPVVVKSAGAATVDNILASFIEKTGGKARYAGVKDRTFEYSGTMQGMTMNITVIQKAPAKIFQGMEVPGMFQSKMAYDGTTAWVSGPQGVMALPPEQAQGFKYDALIDFYKSFAGAGLKAELKGIKDIKGKACYEVAFSDANGLFTTHYFDKETSLRAREVKIQKGPQGTVEQTTDESEYKLFDGFLVATKVEQSVMGQSLTLALKKFQTNSGVADSTFTKPAGK